MIRRLALLTALLCAPLFALAQLSAPQIATLKAYCLADSACTALHNAAADVQLAEWLNTADATYIVWRTSVTQEEIMQDAAFDWTRVDNLTVGKARIWDLMFRNSCQCIAPANSNIRAGIDAAWVGTAADLAVRAAIYAKCKRAATRAERALASGAGTTGSPATMSWSGVISSGEASTIRS